jgi:hypothetical protein
MRCLLLPLTLLLTAVLAASAAASIRLNVGIDGVKIGQTPAQVRANLGTPSSVKNGSDQVSSFTIYRYKALKMVIEFRGTVVTITSTGLGDRTATGVGVGSTEARLKAGVKGLTCEAVSPGRRICHTKIGNNGSRTTTFRLTSGKITEVDVAILAD